MAVLEFLRCNFVMSAKDKNLLMKICEHTAQIKATRGSQKTSCWMKYHIMRGCRTGQKSFCILQKASKVPLLRCSVHKLRNYGKHKR